MDKLLKTDVWRKILFNQHMIGTCWGEKQGCGQQMFWGFFFLSNQTYSRWKQCTAPDEEKVQSHTIPHQVLQTKGDITTAQTTDSFLASDNLKIRVILNLPLLHNNVEGSVCANNLINTNFKKDSQEIYHEYLKSVPSERKKQQQKHTMQNIRYRNSEYQKKRVTYMHHSTSISLG